MATLTFTFDTGSVPLSKIVGAFASAYNYQSTLPDGTPNPETQTQFARRMVRQYIQDIVKSQDVNTAIATATGGITNITLN